jgi:phosphoribosylformylglycinamidine synthase II
MAKTQPYRPPALEPPLHRELGLTDDEATKIEQILGRPPNHLELAMYAVMWSEHCSYKSSRAHLRRLPTEGPGVLVGPGENAGVIDAGGGLAIAIRIESHNHPSAIEPYQGAATGVGGIIRDIFTMGARPIALMDSLRFGPLVEEAPPCEAAGTAARNRWIASGVVRGISGYGNAVGVPTVGGELDFAPCYAANPLVNVVCCGLMPKERLVLARAAGAGNLAVLMGSTTGRDGIGGVSVLASAAFGQDSAAEAAKRPNVQVGDPFEEKRLIEATLELLDRRLVVGIQDLGGAGLTCAASETASRAGAGMDVNVWAVPLREPGMEPFEVMTSESQERMLAIVEPEKLGQLKEVCDRWEVRATVVGKVTTTGRLRVLAGWDGEVLADVPAASLHEGAPIYERPMCPPRARADSLQVPGNAEGPSGNEAGRNAGLWAEPTSMASCDAASLLAEDLFVLLFDPAWAYRQYDHHLYLNTVVGPGADAAVLRLSAPGARPAPGEPERAMALSTDGNPRWCAVDPRAGTALLVAESALNVACTGARPVALVNCLNFGNPEHPEVMWQLSQAIDGMAEACRGLGIPVVGGNVSLYNETAGADIDPTPVVATLGLIDHLRPGTPLPLLAEGLDIWLLGPEQVSLAGSRWAHKAGVRRRGPPQGHRDTAPQGYKAAPEGYGALAGTAGPQPGSRELAPLDLGLHRRVLDLVAGLVNDRLVKGTHDLSDGGLAVALAEMAIKGRTGCHVAGVAGVEGLFGEGPSRVLVSLAPADVPALVARATAADIPARRLGTAGGQRFVVEGLLDVGLGELVAAFEDALPSAFSQS